MRAEVIPFPPRPQRQRPAPAGIGPVAAVAANSRVLSGRSGSLLELRLVLRLDDVPPAQRRLLADLLRSGDLLTLTLHRAEE